MGQFCYLINRKEKIQVEAYQLTASGNQINDIQEPEKLTDFLEYCRENNLTVECVSEHWFYDNTDEDSHKYKDLDS